MSMFYSLISYVLYLSVIGLSAASQHTCDDYTARLTTRSTPSSGYNSYTSKISGTIEIYYGDAWGKVCDATDAFNDIFCNQLGYQEGFAAADTSGSEPLWALDSCSSSYIQLSECGVADWNTTGCTANARVVCVSSESVSYGSPHCYDSCSSQSRLRFYSPSISVSTYSATTSYNYYIYGMLQYYYEDYGWGSINSEGVTAKTDFATVACKAMGLTYDSYYTYSFYGPLYEYNMPPVVDRMRCRDASNYCGCSATHAVVRDVEYASSYASFYYNFGVRCIGRPLETYSGCICANSYVSLENEDDVCDGALSIDPVSSTSRSSTLLGQTGALRIFSEADNVWHRICSDGWSSNDADVACKSMGYDYGLMATVSSHGTKFLYSGVACVGNETDFRDCLPDSEFQSIDTAHEHCTTSYGTYQSAAGVQCYGLQYIDSFEKCDTIPKLLAESPKKLYTKYCEGALRLSTPVTMTLPDPLDKRREYCQWCGSGSCSSNFPYAGYSGYVAISQLELFAGKRWGIISTCKDGFGNEEANVACKQMGWDIGKFSNSLDISGIVYDPNITVWFDEVTCEGDEKSLLDCSHSDWKEVEDYCNNTNPVYVICMSRWQSHSGNLASVGYDYCTGLEYSIPEDDAIEFYEFWNYTKDFTERDELGSFVILFFFVLFWCVWRRKGRRCCCCCPAFDRSNGEKPPFWDPIFIPETCHLVYQSQRETGDGENKKWKKLSANYDPNQA